MKRPERKSRGFATKVPSAAPVLAASLFAGCLFIGGAGLLLGDSPAGVVLLDSKTRLFAYPFTIQNLLHLIFSLGLGLLYIRWRVSVRESAFLEMGYLPEDDETVLRARDLGTIRMRVAGQFDEKSGFLPSMIDLCVLQFQSGRSVDQTVSVLDSNLELLAHRVDLRYSMLKYIAWVIPTVGFIGTVVGIAWTLDQVDPGDPDLSALTQSLAVAFNTTLVALVLSAVLVFFLHLVRNQEEKSLNRAGQYTLKNLINRLYGGNVGKGQPGA